MPALCRHGHQRERRLCALHRRRLADGNSPGMTHADFKNATALSIASGESSAAQDLHWLAQNIPCQAACPAGTDIPGYLEANHQGRFAEAYAINLRDNVFPAILGRVCSRPCENACRHGWEGNGEPVAICFSKRSAADFGQAAPVVLKPRGAPSGKTVAVVGAGVAGLTAARELALAGHRVTVFDKHDKPGGMLYQGIPAFRLPRALIEREIGQVAATGVEIRCGVNVGTDVSLAALAAQYDAVIMAAGTLRPNLLDLPGIRIARHRTRTVLFAAGQRIRAPRCGQTSHRDWRRLYRHGLRAHCAATGCAGQRRLPALA